MSDVEHELITDVAETREVARRLGELALRALAALSEVQDASGAHEQWIDDAIEEVIDRLSSVATPSSDA